MNEVQRSSIGMNLRRSPNDNSPVSGALGILLRLPVAAAPTDHGSRRLLEPDRPRSLINQIRCLLKTHSLRMSRNGLKIEHIIHIVLDADMCWGFVSNL